MTEIIGFTAASITTVSALPQLISLIKTKETKGISLLMFIVLGSGISLWLLYGYLLNDKPLIFANTISLIFILLTIFFILKYKNKEL